jgi:hypothetical protein
VIELLVNYGLEGILKEAFMNHFRHSGVFYINILITNTANLQQT